jgi:ABC-type lipoprotein release transport system permease subunit
LFCKVLQRHDWRTTAKILGVDGRIDVVQILRSGLRKIAIRYAGDHVKQTMDLFSTENKSNKSEQSLKDGERDD